MPLPTRKDPTRPRCRMEPGNGPNLSPFLLIYDTANSLRDFSYSECFVIFPIPFSSRRDAPPANTANAVPLLLSRPTAQYGIESPLPPPRFTCFRTLEAFIAGSKRRSDSPAPREKQSADDKLSGGRLGLQVGICTDSPLPNQTRASGESDLAASCHFSLLSRLHRDILL